MWWPDEIRDPAGLLPEPVELTGDKIDGALALVEWRGDRGEAASQATTRRCRSPRRRGRSST